MWVKAPCLTPLPMPARESANYPFCTIEPNIGVVAVPDQRLDVLAKMYDPEKYTPAAIEFVDIAGLVRRRFQGRRAWETNFSLNIREVDAIVHVVRCFRQATEIIHVDGEASAPTRDIETINLELIFADLDVLERRIDKAQKAAKADKKYLGEVDLLQRLKAHLEQGKSARSFHTASDDEEQILSSVSLLSAKPVIYAANLSEDDFLGSLEENPFYRQVCEIAEAEGSLVLPICAKIEEDIADMSKEDKQLFLDELGLESSGLDRLIQKGYELLGLISYLTAGKQEVRAWTIKKGTKAPQAAGKIHSDFEKGFIRAEVVAFDDLEACGSMAAAKEKGLVRSEGKDYVFQDGDVVLFRFNV